MSLLWWLKKQPKSVFFCTFHKCASTLFSYFLLQHVNDLKHVDYSEKISVGEKKPIIKFKRRGYIYGPIRLSSEPHHPDFVNLGSKILSQGFANDKKFIFFIRDPRDIIVSRYYSFGFSHKYSINPEISALQKSRRTNIQSQTIDEYALYIAPKILGDFNNLITLNNKAQLSIILKYEDMIHQWEKFIKQLKIFIQITPKTEEELFIRSRPNLKENIYEHKRSGKTEGFREKLNLNTIQSLNNTFGKILLKFNYPN